MLGTLEHGIKQAFQGQEMATEVFQLAKSPLSIFRPAAAHAVGQDGYGQAMSYGIDRGQLYANRSLDASEQQMFNPPLADPFLESRATECRKAIL